MFNATNQLNNITNNNIISSSNKWRKPEVQLARSATRELELQQKLKNSASSSSSQPKEKENSGSNNKTNADSINNKPSSSSSNVNLSQSETLDRKKKFATYRFYLDNLEPNAKAKIERGIKLLGASQEAFFSNKCTHLITTKNIPTQDNLLQSNCDTNSTTTKQTKGTSRKPFVPRDSIVENALSWGITLWSSEVMQNTVDYFLKYSTFKRQAQEKRGLGKVLQEEKLFGPSTGANSEAQSKRPQFVAYTGHYLVIEDATQVHRPVVAREYTKELLPNKRQHDYPWPFIKTTAPFRSPFGKRAPPPSSARKEEKVTEENNNKENTTATTPSVKPQVKAVALSITNDNKLQIKTPPHTPITTPTSTPAVGIHPITSTTTAASFNITTPPATPGSAAAIAGIANPESQFSLRASGFQPSCTNNIQSASTRSVSTSVSTMQNDNRRLPPGESVNRLDKRMVENVTQKEHQKLHKQAVKTEKEKRDIERARKEKEKKKDLRYCENCNCQFEKLEEHMNDQTHQTFIRDQNNFKDLDALLERTHRVYKMVLPDHWKSLIDVNIDGKNVKFASDTLKRSRTTSSSTSNPPNKLTTALMNSKQVEVTHIAGQESTSEKEQGWDKYHDVFLS